MMPDSANSCREGCIFLLRVYFTTGFVARSGAYLALC